MSKWGKKKKWEKGKEVLHGSKSVRKIGGWSENMSLRGEERGEACSTEHK